jgi:tRNA threonylcarbamoyladenosine biosynthesis protein TsaB
MAAILFIDTCTSTGLIAILDTEKAPVVQELPDAQRFAEQLHIAIEQLLGQNGYRLADLNAIAVVNGPGSYTGLRVGLSTAKGLCFALDCPLLAFNRLALLDAQFRKMQLISGTAAVLIPARKEEWFGIATDADGTFLLSPQHLTETEWQQWLGSQKRQVAVAVASDSLKSVEGWVPKALFLDNRLDPVVIQPVVLTAFKDGTTADLIAIRPDYLKNAYTTN